MRPNFRRNIIKQMIKFLYVLKSPEEQRMITSNMEVLFSVFNRAKQRVLMNDVVSCPEEFWYFYE